MREIIRQGINHVLNMGASYAEARGIKATHTNISARDGEIEKIHDFTDIGIGIRVFHKGGIGFSYTTNTDDKNHIRNIAENAFRIAKLSGDYEPDPRSVSTLEKNKPLQVKEHPKDISIEEKSELCLRACKVALDYDERIRTVISKLGEYHGQTYYLNSAGADISYEFLELGFYVQCHAYEQGTTTMGYDECGGTYGLEIFQKPQYTVKNIATNAAEESIEELNSKQAPEGAFPALIDPFLAGMIAHECVGHLFEADISDRESSVELGDIISPESVTIIDEGIPPEGGFHIPYDDEGVPCQRVELVKKGVANSYLHNRKTASMHGVEPTGNARAQDYSFEPLVRLRNIYFKPGHTNYKEVLQDIDEGIYAIDLVSINRKKDFFFFKVSKGYWVENGECKYPLKDFKLRVNPLSVMKKIELVCDDFRIASDPFYRCKKNNQYLMVGNGGPHLYVRNVFFQRS